MSRPPLSTLRSVDGLVFISGQLARGEDGAIVAGDINAQSERALKNLATALQDDGLSLRDVVKVTVWLTDASFATSFNVAYTKFFERPYPARSMVISGLVASGALVEIEAIAMRP